MKLFQKKSNSKKDFKMMTAKIRNQWIWAAVLNLAVFLGAGSTVLAASENQDAANPAPVTASGGKTDLTSESLDNLLGLNVQVVSSAKKVESLRDATSAIFVITQDDIRRSGAQHLADLLTMVPGVQVARQSANEWAISARGFNGNYNNKMLVLIDGRSVYDPILGGVTWNQQDIPLEEIDHIEVIRGPGGTLYGANAMNGIVNIITKDSKATQGLYVSGSGGYPFYNSTTTGTTGMNGIGSAHYGGKLGDDLFYRVYFQADNQEPSENPAGGAWNDDWYDFRGGFKSDWHADQDTLTLEAEAQSGHFNYERLNVNGFAIFNPQTLQAFSDINTNVDQNAHILGRWTRDFTDNSQIQLLTYYNYDNQTTTNDARLTNIGQFDIEFQHRFNLGSWNEIIYGGSFRNYSDEFYNQINFVYPEANENLNIYGGFLQDKITLEQDRLYLTGGTKLENNTYTGDELEPSGRLLWTPDSKNSVWAAVSRSVRIPTQFSEEGYLYAADVPEGSHLPPAYGGPTTPENYFAGAIPNNNLVGESLVSYELGYRTNLTKETSVDIASFYNHYDNLIGFKVLSGQSYSPLGGVFYNLSPLAGLKPALAQFVILQQQNLYAGNIYGVELSGKWDPTANVHFALGYTYQAYDQNMINASSPVFGAPPPHNLINGRLTYEPIHGLELNTAFYYTDPTFLYNNVSAATPFTTPSYVQWNLGATWKTSDNWEFALRGMDLEGAHTETLSAFGVAPTLIVPSFYAQVTARY